MPKFTIRMQVDNKSGVPVKAYVGASLVGQINSIEYFNTADDIKHIFPVGKSVISRYLNTELGQPQKYTLYVALWSADKPIGQGTRYVIVAVRNAVEKKKKKLEVKFDLKVLNFSPTSFTG